MNLDNLGDPMSVSGALHWVLIGVVAIVLVLVVGQYFPTLLPARASATKI